MLYAGPGAGRNHLLCLESSSLAEYPDATSHALCRVIERLSPEARKLWAKARRKEFNIGYELPADLRAVQVNLRPDTARRIVELGATIAFTCYRFDDAEPVTVKVTSERPPSGRASDRPATPSKPRRTGSRPAKTSNPKPPAQRR